MSGPPILSAARLDFAFEPGEWDFARERRTEIDAVFAQMQAERPALWNGRVLLMKHYAFDNGVMRGAFFETDFASFSAWRRWNRPVAVYDCFGAGAIETADGAFLLGVMAAHTFNGGQIYFPCGTPDAGDIAGGKVDLDSNIRRELMEETGLDTGELTPEPGWTIVTGHRQIAAVKVMRSALPAERLRQRIMAHLAKEAQPELADIRIVRSPADLDGATMDFARRFLVHRFTGGKVPDHEAR